MDKRSVGIIMNGVTGRMGYNQHLLRSILAIRDQGGIRSPSGDIWPEPILVGRKESKLREIADLHRLTRFTTSLDDALAEPDAQIYFDAQVTQLHEPSIRKAIEAGMHIYAEKPLAERVSIALDLARAADAAGVRTGVVQDKLFLPGLRKVARLIEGGFFGRILSVRGEFGYWVFEGDWQTAQRPSWNYRTEDGGGIALDMFCHWEYLLHNLFGRVTEVQAMTATHIEQRVDEQGQTYSCTADDAAYGIFQLEGGVVAQINSSWAVRVFRDELVEFQIDGTEGSAVAGLRRCRAQHRSVTPKPVWNPDIATAERFREQWTEVPDNAEFDNGFKVQWEMFLRHVLDDAPWAYDFRSAARGVQLAELGLRSAAEGRRLTVPEITL